MQSIGYFFISYSHVDRDHALQLVELLSKCGFKVWIDDRINQGDMWWNKIEDAIQNCTAFIVIMSPTSRASKWVQREVAYADNLNKPLFPVLLSGNVWPLFVMYQYLDATKGIILTRGFVDALSMYVQYKIVFSSPVSQEGLNAPNEQPRKIYKHDPKAKLISPLDSDALTHISVGGSAKTIILFKDKKFLASDRRASVEEIEQFVTITKKDWESQEFEALLPEAATIKFYTGSSIGDFLCYSMWFEDGHLIMLIYTSGTPVRTIRRESRELLSKLVER